MQHKIKMAFKSVVSVLFSGYLSSVLAIDYGAPATFPIVVTPSFETAGFLVTQLDGQTILSGEFYYRGSDNVIHVAPPLVKYDQKTLPPVPLN
jgi:hypothetical protein